MVASPSPVPSPAPPSSTSPAPPAAKKPNAGSSASLGLSARFKSSQVRELAGHKRNVHHLAWNSIGTVLATGSGDGIIKLWSVTGKQGREVGSLKGHEGSVNQICWNPTNPREIASVSADKSVRIWDAKTKRCLRNIQTPGENINIAWSPDGRSIAVSNKKDFMSIIDVRNGKVVDTKQWNFEVNELSWDRSGKYLFLTTGQRQYGHGIVEVVQAGCNFEKMTHIHSINAHTSNCYCISFDPTGKYMAVGSADSLVSIWSLDDMVCVRTIQNLDWPIRAVAFSYDGTYIACASDADQFIEIYNARTGERVHGIDTRKVPTASLAWHPKRNVLAYSGEELGVRNGGRPEGLVRVLGW